MSIFNPTIIDATKDECPEATLRLNRVVRGAEHRNTVKLVTTDPGTERDIPAYCKHNRGCHMIRKYQRNGKFYFLIRIKPIKNKSSSKTP